MVYKIEVVERDVRIAIDENKSGDCLINDGDIDTLSLNDIIRSKIVEAVRRVESSAPVDYLDEGVLFGDAIYWDGNGRCSGWMLLPDDFMRLVAFRMSDWERTCYRAISVYDPLYALQWSRFRGVRGNFQQPVCAVVNRSVGKVLEFFGCRSEGAYVQRASYIPYPCIDEYGGIEISERCYTAVVYTAAALVLTAYGASEQAAAMDTLAKSIFE